VRPRYSPRNKLRLQNLLKLAQESLRSDTPALASMTEQHAFTFPGTLSPIFLPPEHKDEQLLLPDPHENTISIANWTSMLAKESGTKSLRNTPTHEFSQLEELGHQHSVRENTFDNNNFELEVDQIGTSTPSTQLVPSTRIHSEKGVDTVQWGLRHIPQNTWQPLDPVSLSRFVARNPLLPGPTFEPVIDVAVPLDESFSTELHDPFVQTHTYSAANTELEEINALNQSWLELSTDSQGAADAIQQTLTRIVRSIQPLRSERISIERRSHSAGQRFCAIAERDRRELLCILFKEEQMRELGANRDPAHTWKSLLMFIVLAFGQYVMRKIRSFLNFFSWR
jgi:hypothetical protein